MKKLLKSLLVLLSVLLLFSSLSACSKRDSKLEGTWVYSQDQEFSDAFDAIKVFNSDGTGMDKIGDHVMEFTYETKNGVIYYTYQGDTDVFENQYSIKGDVLTWIDALGEPSYYNKQK